MQYQLLINIFSTSVKTEQAAARSPAARLASKDKEIENAVYDLKAVNPNKKPIIDTRTPEELLDIIDAKGKEITEVLYSLRIRVYNKYNIPQSII